jgi:outer membrane lipoprotein-sorting protein
MIKSLDIVGISRHIYDISNYGDQRDEMKKMAIMVILGLLVFAMPALAEQKLINITEDTLAEDSYRPVAGKEFLVAVKLVEEIEGQEQAVSSETIQFQASMGSLSDTEVTTNIYGEAITWLTTDTTPDTSYSISASVKDKPEVASITIQVRNIALPQGSPSAEELIQKVEENSSKIQDMKADIEITTNSPWDSSLVKLRIWKKGNKYKAQEISPNPNIYNRPVLAPPSPMAITREIAGYNPSRQVYKISAKNSSQGEKFPLYYDFVDTGKEIIIKKENYLQGDSDIHKIVIEDSSFTTIDGIQIFQDEEETVFEGINKIRYQTQMKYTNIQLNSGMPDSEFN